MLPSNSFIVLHFTFRPMLHFKLIFVKGVRSVSTFTSLHMDVQLFQHYLLERLPFSMVLPLLLCQRSVGLYLHGSVSGLSDALIYLSVLSPIPHYLGYCSTIVSLLLN